MKNFLLFALLPLLCDSDVDVIGQYVNIELGRNWIEAQKYCKENLMDLATVTSEEQHQELTANGRWGWIGLYRPATLPVTWQWSDGRLTNFFKWKSGRPDMSQIEACVYMYNPGWYDESCSYVCPFYCQERIIFVKENKTWDEALEYCRSNYTGLFLNVNSAKWLDLATKVNQRVSVWAGLRFLDGKWILLNGAQDRSLDSLPSCPVQTYRCGARNFNNNVWENRDCNEKLYFLCY